MHLCIFLMEQHFFLSQMKVFVLQIDIESLQKLLVIFAGDRFILLKVIDVNDNACSTKQLWL